MKSLPVLLPALITPFTKAGELDLAAHKHNLEFLSESGIEGFLVAGSTGEGQYLEEGERRDLCATARQALGAAATVLCGLAAETLRTGLRQAREAIEGGADAVVAITPTALVRGDMKAVIAYYRQLADQSPLPVLLYSVPRFTGYELPDEAVATLASHPNIVGMKDSGGHPVRMQRLVKATPTDFTMFTGSSSAVRLAVAAGAHGAITASTNYAPGLVGEIINQAQRRSDDDTAQHALATVAGAIEGYGVPGVKVAAAAIGLQPGHARKPLEPLTPKLSRQVADMALGLQAQNAQEGA